MRQEDNRQPMGSESLGTLVSSWRDGTFSEIWADWKWIWGYTKRYRRAVWFYTILGVASSTLGLVSAVASKYSIDIITGYDSDHLWFIVTVMVASALVGLLLRSVTSRISTKISLRVNNDIQAQVFDRLLGADWRSLNAFASGDLLSRLSTDVGSVSSSAIRWLPDLIVTAYTFAATLAVILHYDWVMALLALASAPFLLLTSRRLIRGMRTHQQEVRQVGSRLMSYETETLHNLDAIKGFGITGRYGRGFPRPAGGGHGGQPPPAAWPGVSAAGRRSSAGPAWIIIYSASARRFSCLFWAPPSRWRPSATACICCGPAKFYTAP